jgi:hypothetical protein
MEYPFATEPGGRDFYRVVKMIGAELERNQNSLPVYPSDSIHAAALVSMETESLNRSAYQFNYLNIERENMQGAAIRTAARAIRFLMNVERMRVHKSTVHKIDEQQAEFKHSQRG